MTIQADVAGARIETEELIESLNSVSSIPIVPFKNGQVDFDGHRKNVDYLIDNNHLEGERRRVIAIAGTSLVHHISFADQARLLEVTGERLAGRGVLMAGIVPNPLPDAALLVEEVSRNPFPPDVYLLMPLTGICSPVGLYQTYMELGERLGGDCGARFLYYLRQSDHVPTVVRLVKDSPHFIGAKVGTGEEDVEPLVDGFADAGLVMWGIGDRCTGGARRGTLGHTSGINVAFARASDEINNAQRRGDFEEALKIESEVGALEDIRFRDGRMYNYSAVIEAMHLGGWDDVEPGDGGPFNPRVPPEVAEEVRAAIANIRRYH